MFGGFLRQTKKILDRQKDSPASTHRMTVSANGLATIRRPQFLALLWPSNTARMNALISVYFQRDMHISGFASDMHAYLMVT